ncbi:TIGR02646 family protein [Providencia stuartii]|uniref:retron Ec78 anti-phage system effector HNH endonuclease PtuB n=1 Tax=unclassified Providencia TaxID=2633465 RepID=UPI00234A3540|nr:MULTISPECIES: retron Ec78 anti-phage system effector HNH endonuclease PtuB [unclassified Providencia]ELR5122934.1 TIGR02646 family protein [Providencia stuartii]
MKQLQRQGSPSCLAHLIGGQNSWNDVDRLELWIAIDAMQNNLCAYCECHLGRKHIEHFRSQHDYSHLTFDWNNLFGSCGDSSRAGGWSRCGIYKDQYGRPYNPDNLIKPDVDNPSDFLRFLISGSVRPCNGLSPRDQLKAEETIRVFNLNNDVTLTNRRRQAIALQIEAINALNELKEDVPPEDWDELLQSQLEELQNTEFGTALAQAYRFNRQY